MACRGANDEMLTIASSIAFFTTTYFLLRKFVFPKHSSSFNNRMASLVHALIMLPVSASVLDFQKPWQDIGTRTSDSQVRQKYSHDCVMAGLLRFLKCTSSDAAWLLLWTELCSLSSSRALRTMIGRCWLD